MAEFWETHFKAKQEMWGQQPADSARATAREFEAKGLTNILIPGFGYGRNAKPFLEYGCRVTGIEISQTAINIATQHFGEQMTIHHGSVTDMPFDEVLYDGVFCYALIHLLDEEERAKLIRDCHSQLKPGGYMVFVAISTKTKTFGEGINIGKNRFETRHGVKLFYYDQASITAEFGACGLVEATEINDPAKPTDGNKSQIFWKITCVKK
ncbi:class I SAM-dependent methyltransferase [Neolewinella aurantiaca]|uniref:Class I SAM-dependent methyltransferase n=1 Tax=Neolewinella aurantiaca TaxID=2602767 RepID=A0A5C7FC31_9BACT|nr:class I SAM-dependent methyltransferase [Neolewinella aurantiaca]TXF84381.1 class I SAM-dependent methyltransferase [Neolewinella aurantiaca]